MTEAKYAEQDYDGAETKGHSPKSKDASSKPGLDLSEVQQVLQQNLKNLLPALMAFEDQVEILIARAYPYAMIAYNYFVFAKTFLEPYGLNAISKCLTGFAMMFFGGFFITTVATYEAIQQGGYQNFKTALNLLYTQFRSFKAANLRDNEEDLDNDNIPDVEQISNQQFFLRKLLLFFKATDPNVLSQVLHSLYTIFIAVLATLRLQFARTLSLGASIGDQLNEILNKMVVPVISKSVPTEYQKWVEPTTMYFSRFVGVWIAFAIQRLLATVHSAVKGARVFTAGLTELSVNNGVGYLTEGYLDEALSAVLAGVGIYLQLFAWSQLPIIIKLVFFPAFLVESLLSTVVSVGLVASTPTTIV